MAATNVAAGEARRGGEQLHVAVVSSPTAVYGYPCNIVSHQERTSKPSNGNQRLMLSLLLQVLHKEKKNRQQHCCATTVPNPSSFLALCCSQRCRKYMYPADASATLLSLTTPPVKHTRSGCSRPDLSPCTSRLMREAYSTVTCMHAGTAKVNRCYVRYPAPFQSGTELTLLVLAVS